VSRAALLTLTLLGCSTSSKREDSPAMPQPPPSAGSGSATVTQPPAAAQPIVYLGAPNGEVPVKVEVVATEAKIERGLMYREHLPLDAGMLFLMGETRQWTFWMKNTLIPLDMIFIKSDMTIAGIVENAEPQTETLRKVDEPSLYVLEVNGGFTKQTGVVAGAKVRFENLPPQQH
jgi:hypothetical protein